MTSAPERPRRILHIASWHPSRVHGTLGNFVERHVQAISSRHGGEIWFAAAVPAGQIVPANSVRECGTYTERIFYFRSRKPHVRHVTNALLRAARSAEAFDLIHLHVAYPAGRAARTLARRWNVPLVLTEHWTAYHPDQRSALPWWRKLSMRSTGRAAHIICPVSDNLGHSMQSFGIKGRYVPVPNVVDTELFHPAATTPSDEAFHVLHISSLHDDQKNISGMLRAVRRAMDRAANLRVSIIGDGNPEPHRAYAIELGLDERVEIAGEISLAEVAERMRASNALMLFSRYENFPCVIPEAWASGIPVISTDVGGIREHLTPERGALIGSEDETTLADVLCQWAQQRKRFDTASLRHHADSTFSYAAVARAYSDVYARVLTSESNGS